MPTRNDSPGKPGRATGPRTPQGKARSSQNARKHGLTAQTVPLDPAVRAEYDRLRKDYENELGPRGPREMSIFEELVLAAWQLQRFARLEKEIDLGPELLLDDAEVARIDRLHRYYARARRYFHKALNELRALRMNRSKSPNEVSRRGPYDKRSERNLEKRTDTRPGLPPGQNLQVPQNGRPPAPKQAPTFGSERPATARHS